MQFNELSLSPEVLKAITEMGFETPSEIQEKTIPLLLSGKDVIGRSQTGTGKTAAFGIPAVESISRNEKKGVEVLILCPTRELAMQACEELKKFARFMPWVRPCAVYGGSSMERQIMDLKRGANIVVGTPGRVMDHMERRTLRLENLREIILDEADEMLNMGFREDIETILKSVPVDRQTVLFSATMPPPILAITRQYQTEPELIKVAQKSATVEAIAQYYYEVPLGRKTDALQMLLTMYEPKRSMVFCNTKRMVDELTEALNSRGFQADGIHGDMKQPQRTQVMDRFKGGKTSILIATDVAARGIDVDDIDAVFNYDLPQDTEYYVHRIGRTGRAGKTGTAYTLISGRKQVYELRDIIRATRANIEHKALPSVSDVKNKRLDKFIARIQAYVENNRIQEGTVLLQKLEEQGLTAEQVALALLSMRLSKEAKRLPEALPTIVRRDPASSNNHTPASGRPRTVKVVLSVGKKQQIAPNYVLGALVDATGMPGRSFGKIDIFDKHTTVEIPEADQKHVIDSMQGGKINGNRVSVRLYDHASDGNGKRYNNRRGNDGRRTEGSHNGYDRGRKGNVSRYPKNYQ